MKKIKTVFICLLCLTGLSCTAAAAEEAIASIDVTAVLRADGAADFTEVWAVQGPYSGTEYYIFLGNMKDMTVSGLTVSDDSGSVYEYQSVWNVDGSFDDKAYKCGIVQDGNNYELCWGISRMEEGITYTVSYQVTGFVKRYEDADGFYHRFISSGLSSNPQRVSVTIRSETAFSRDNAGIWTYGFDGEIQFTDGMIYACSTEALRDSQYVNILAGFEKGIFDGQPASGTFEDLRTKAENDNNTLRSALLLLAFLIGLAAVISVVFYLALRNIKLQDGSRVKRPSIKKVEEAVLLPFSGSIPQAYGASTLYYSSAYTALNPIAAYVAKWELEKRLTVEGAAMDEADVKKKKNVQMILGEAPAGDQAETSLFKMMKAAADSDALTLKAWRKWAEKHEKELTAWRKSLETQGREALIAGKLAGEDGKKRVRLTQQGYDKYIGAIGFLKYLRSMKENHISAERENWGSYIVFAALFGLADTVTKRLQTDYPEDFDSYCGSYGMNTAMFFTFMTYSNHYASVAQTVLSGGEGGSAGASGGGGFSGGGGGGSR